MARDISLLDRVRIASPCDVGWDNMVGDDRVRFCDKCQQNVYNLTAMTSAEAEHFLVEREGRACVRAYRRADGTIRIGDCPWGVRVARRAAAKVIGLAGAVLITILQIGHRLSVPHADKVTPYTPEPFTEVKQQISELQNWVNLGTKSDGGLMP